MTRILDKWLKNYWDILLAHLKNLKKFFVTLVYSINTQEYKIFKSSVNQFRQKLIVRIKTKEI